MTASKGIKLYGAKAVAAMFKEYKQLDDLKVLGRLNPELLQHDQKRKALRAVKLIKLKHCGCLAAVKPKTIKLTYAETVRVKTAVEAQNCLISNGGDPTND